LKARLGLVIFGPDAALAQRELRIAPALEDDAPGIVAQDLQAILLA
jgi:hypothetical protein